MASRKSVTRSSRAPSRTLTQSGALAAAPKPPTPADHALWQEAHDQVEAAFDKANAALATTRDKPQRQAIFDLADALSDQLNALDQQDMEDRTIDLEAASAQLDPGIERLTTLQQQLKQIAQDFATAAEVIGAVDGAISGMKAFLAIL